MPQGKVTEVTANKRMLASDQDGKARRSVHEDIQITRERESPPVIPPGPGPVNVLMMGLSPATARAQVMMSSAHSSGLLLNNSIQAQQRLALVNQQAMLRGLGLLRTLNTAASASAASRLPRQFGVRRLAGRSRRTR